MKKIFLSVAIASTFIACNKNQSSTSANNSEVTQQGKDASYAFGMMLGGQIEDLKNNPANTDSINLNVVEKGVQDYLKNPEEKGSYAFGLKFGEQINTALKNPILKDGLSKEEILKGLSDYINKKDTRIGKDSINVLMQKFYESQQSKLAEKGKQEGKEFMAKTIKEAGVKTTPSGLAYKVIKEGTGKQAALGKIIKVKYTGKTIDGKVFDSSDKAGQPDGIELKLENGSLIPGWVEGLQLMKEGGKYELYVPAELAYGDKQAGPDIKPGSTLVFDLELVSVNDKPEQPAQPSLPIKK